MGIVFSSFIIGCALLYGQGREPDSIENIQTIKGVVIEENYRDDFFGDRYQVAIKKEDGNKVVIKYDDFYSNSGEAFSLNTLFSNGDYVSLRVGTAEKIGCDGKQKYAGLSGKLIKSSE